MTFLAFLLSTLGITSLTLPQMVLVKVAFDGVDPADLPEAERAVAVQLFGDVDRYPPEARSVLALLKGARVGGTWLCSLWLLYRALVAPLNGLAAGELAFAVVVAPDTRLARQAIRFALGAAKACPEIAPLVESQTTDGFIIRRPDGYRVQLEALPATRGGSALRGRTLVAALMDESSFFRDRDSGSVNDSELYRALIVRCSVPGAMLLVVSTAWLESGVLHELIGKNHPERGGRPASAVAAIAPTELMREGDAHVQRIVAEERERDPQNAAREFDCVAFSGGAGLFFDTQAINACLVDFPHPMPPEKGCYVGAGVDPAFRSDAFAGVITRQRRNEVVFEVAEVFERRPERGAPLVPSVVMGEFSKVAKRHGARALATDSFYVESVREHARNAGLSVYSTPDGQRGKARLFIAAREIIHGQRLHIPASLVALARQLREVVTRPTPGGGFSITSPRRRGAHGDLVSALVHSLWRAEAGARTADAEGAWFLVTADSRAYEPMKPGVYESGRRVRKDYTKTYQERIARFLND